MPRPLEFHTQKPAKRKAFSLGRRCHAFWRDGCGAYRIPSGSEIRTGSPPHPSRLAPCHPLQQERALLRETSPVLLSEGSPYTGEPFSLSRRLLRRFITLWHCRLAGGACRRPLEFHTQKQRSAASRRAGGGGCPQGQSEGVYGSNFVGEYRTIAFTVPVAYTPSVTGNGP